MNKKNEIGLITRGHKMNNGLCFGELLIKRDDLEMHRDIFLENKTRRTNEILAVDLRISRIRI